MVAAVVAGTGTVVVGLVAPVAASLAEEEAWFSAHGRSRATPHPTTWGMPAQAHEYHARPQVLALLASVEVEVHALS